MVPNCSPGQYASIYTQRNSFRSNFKVDLSRPLCIMLFAMTFGDFNIHLNQTIVFTKVVVLLTNYQAPLTVFCCDSWFSRSNGSPTLRTHPILSLSEPAQKSVRRIASGFDGRRSTVYNQRCFVYSTRRGIATKRAPAARCFGWRACPATRTGGLLSWTDPAWPG